MNISSDRLAVFSDFDGTITMQDTLVYLLDAYGSPEWWDIENKLLKGTITEKEALPAEIDILNVGWDEAESAVLKHIEITPGFKEFKEWTDSLEIPFAILSGGFKEISAAILNHHFKSDFSIFANSLEISGKRWKVVPSNGPKIKNLCNNCKTFPLVQLKDKGFTVVYIGDGSTDRCPSENADIVFAKSGLADYCRENSIPYYPYTDFFDILNELIRMID